MLKQIFFIIILLSTICCSFSKKNNNFGDTNNHDEKSHINKDSLAIDYLTSNTFEKYKDSLTITDTLNTIKVKLYVPYKYTHNDWAILVGKTLFYELNKYGYLDSLKNKGITTYYYSVIYNINDQNPEGLYLVEVNHFLSYEKSPLFYKYCQYIISNMSPSDFQAYDWAFETIYEETNNELFNTTFLDFIIKLSMDKNLDYYDEIIFQKLLKWVDSRNGIEKKEHFMFFKNSLERSIDVPYDDSKY